MILRGTFYALAAIGKPMGGIRPRRIYDIIGRRAWPRPSYRWHRNRWGDELNISPHQHIDRCVMAFGCYDPDLHTALEKLLRPGMVCLDVGANFGELSLHMAQRVSPGGMVHAFEPAPAPYARLVEHVRHNQRQVVCHQLALSDRSGHIAMTVPTAAADNQGLGAIGTTRAPAGYTTEQVEMTTLDAFAETHQLSKIDFIKLDIQGAEPLLIKGAEKTLRQFRPLIVSEISPVDLRNNGNDSQQYVEMVLNAGYSVYELTRQGMGKKITKVTPDFDATNVVFAPEK